MRRFGWGRSKGLYPDVAEIQRKQQQKSSNKTVVCHYVRVGLLGRSLRAWGGGEVGFSLQPER